VQVDCAIVIEFGFLEVLKMKRTAILVSTFALVRSSTWYHYTSEHRVGGSQQKLVMKGDYVHVGGLATAIHTLDAQQYRIDSTATRHEEI
jgi:hypothetical protein